MGLYDTVMVPCPNCGEKSDFQSKSGDCYLDCYELDDAPADVMFDVNRHAPNRCLSCGTWFYVQYETYKPDNRTISVRNVKSVECDPPNYA